jgi:hypothetical protein
MATRQQGNELGEEERIGESEREGQARERQTAPEKNEKTNLDPSFTLIEIQIYEID